jgi:hypothetical protein
VGRTILFAGYWHEFAPDHPHCSKWGYVFQHRLVAEAIVGRHLRPEERVHHEDENKGNNSPENLWLFPNQAAHLAHHKRNSWVNRQDFADAVRPLAADRRVSTHEAAKRLGVNSQTVRAVCLRWRIPWLSAADRGLDEASVREALQGRTTLEAATHLGVNHGTLRYRFDHLLPKRVSPGSLDAHREEIRSLARSIRSDALGERYGVNPMTVRNAIRGWAKEAPDAWSDVLAFQRSRRGLGRPPRRKASAPLPTPG